MKKLRKALKAFLAFRCVAYELCLYDIRELIPTNQSTVWRALDQ